MVMITSYYKFQLRKQEGRIRMSLDRLEKVGNHPTLNKMFDKHDKLLVHKVTPTEIEEYIGYVVGTSVGIVSWLPIIFETATYSYPHGLMKAKELNDVVLFRIVNESIFEVFVLNVKKEFATSYLQLMMDGHLENEILRIQSECV